MPLEVRIGKQTSSLMSLILCTHLRCDKNGNTDATGLTDEDRFFCFAEKFTSLRQCDILQSTRNPCLSNLKADRLFSKQLTQLKNPTNPPNPRQPCSHDSCVHTKEMAIHGVSVLTFTNPSLLKNWTNIFAVHQHPLKALHQCNWIPHFQQNTNALQQKR